MINKMTCEPCRGTKPKPKPKPKLSRKGYLTKAGEQHYGKLAIEKLKRKGFIKDGKLLVEYNTKAKNLKAGDLVITFEIHKVLDNWEWGTSKEFRCVDVLPMCSTSYCRKHGCGHECIKHTGLGQQGITKILKQD